MSLIHLKQINSRIAYRSEKKLSSAPRAQVPPKKKLEPQFTTQKSLKHLLRRIKEVKMGPQEDFPPALAPLSFELPYSDPSRTTFDAIAGPLEVAISWRRSPISRR